MLLHVGVKADDEEARYELPAAFTSQTALGPKGQWLKISENIRSLHRDYKVPVHNFLLHDALFSNSNRIAELSRHHID